MSTKQMTLPVYRGDVIPTETGMYVCYERGSSRIIVMGWCVEAKQRDWRHGAGLIHVSAYAGPLPVRRGIE